MWLHMLLKLGSVTLPMPSIYTVYIVSTTCPCIFDSLISTVLSIRFLTLGVHVPEGYVNRSVCVHVRVCMGVCLFVVFCHHAHVDPEI